MAGKALAVLALAAVPHAHGFRGKSPGKNLMVQDAELLEDAVKTEAQVVERMVESVADQLSKKNVDTKQVKGSFQVGESSDEFKSKMKATVSIWHESSPEATSTGPWLEGVVTAKSASKGAKFARTLTSQLSKFGFNAFVTAWSRGDLVTLKSAPLPPPDRLARALQTLSTHMLRADVTGEGDVDFQRMLKDHSDKLIFEELYKGLRISIDTALTPALEEALGHLAEQAKERSTALKVLVDLFQGLFFNVRVQYSGKVAREVFSSVPVLNMTAADMIERYRELGEGIPMKYRGHPLPIMALDLVQEADNCLKSFDRIELKGLPSGVRIAVKEEGVNPFAIFNTFVKETCLDKVIRNETQNGPCTGSDSGWRSGGWSMLWVQFAAVASMLLALGRI